MNVEQWWSVDYQGKIEESRKKIAQIPPHPLLI
jgi:hypothetical protein